MGRDLAKTPHINDEFQDASSQEAAVPYREQVKQRPEFEKEFEEFTNKYRGVETGLLNGESNIKYYTNGVRNVASWVDMLPLDFFGEVDTGASMTLGAGAGLADSLVCLFRGDFRSLGEELLCIPAEAFARGLPLEYLGLLELVGEEGWDPHDIARQWVASPYRSVVGGESGIVAKTDEQLAEMFIKAKNGQKNALTKDIKTDPNKPANFVSANLLNKQSQAALPEEKLENDGGPA
ncbi:MAG: hypothetical protein ACT4OY_06345 [Alphaproteobacteria bacterium]